MNGIAEKFPVWQTAMDVLDYCWRQRRLMERYGLIPMTIGVVTTWALLSQGVSQSEPSAALFIALAVEMVIFLPPTVAWYRTVVYGAEAARRPMFALTRLEWRLFLWQLLIIAPLIAAIFLGTLVVAPIAIAAKAAGGETAAVAVMVPVVGAAAVLLVVFMVRISMVLALASLDTPAGFRRAWDLTKNMAWRLTGALVIIVLAVALFGALAELVAWLVGALIAIARGSEIAVVVPYVRAVAQAPTGLLLLFASATLFGLVYKLRAEQTPEVAPEDGATGT